MDNRFCGDCRLCLGNASCMKSYVINRIDRPERLAYVIDELQKAGIRAEVFPAIVGSPGWRGCRDSHLAIMELCKNENMFAVYEDDVSFIEDTQFAAKAIMQTPDNWDFLSLGCSPQAPLSTYSENLITLNQTAFCLHAYIINNRNGLAKYVLSHRAEIQKIDVWFSENVYKNPKFNCFVTYPLVATQVQFQSDTCKRSDVSTIVKQYYKFVE